MKYFRYLCAILVTVFTVCIFFSYPLPGAEVQTKDFFNQKITCGFFLDTVHYIQNSNGVNIIPVHIYKYIPLHSRIKIKELISPFAAGIISEPKDSSLDGFTDIIIKTKGKLYRSKLIIPDLNKPEYIEDFTYPGAVELMSVLVRISPKIIINKHNRPLYKWIDKFKADITDVSLRERNGKLFD